MAWRQRRRERARAAAAQEAEAAIAGWRSHAAHELRQSAQAIALLAGEVARSSPGAAAASHLVTAASLLNRRIALLFDPGPGRGAGESQARPPAGSAAAEPPARRPAAPVAARVARPSDAGPAAAGPDRPAAGAGARVDDPFRPSVRVLVLDEAPPVRLALAHALGALGVEVIETASLREAIAHLLSIDALPDLILINRREGGEPLHKTLLGIGHALQARVPIVVLSGGLMGESRAEPEQAWRELGVVAVRARPRTLSGLRRMVADPAGRRREGALAP